MRSFRLRGPARGPRRAKGDQPRQGRVVNDIEAQVVPKGTIRSTIQKHKKAGNLTSRTAFGAGDETIERQAAIRGQAEREAEATPGIPKNWTTARGRQHLNDLLSSRAPRD